MTISRRSLNKWHRLAYELEEDAARVRNLGHREMAGALKAASSLLGDAVRFYED